MQMKSPLVHLCTKGLTQPRTADIHANLATLSLFDATSSSWQERVHAAVQLHEADLKSIYD